MLIPRKAAKPLAALAKEYPVLVVTGPRQAGKTTLCKAAFPHLPYASLEDPDVRRLALEDPRGFLAQYPGGALLDEVQRAPELLSYLQGIVDREPRPGSFVLTGSQQLECLKISPRQPRGPLSLPSRSAAPGQLAALGRAAAYRGLPIPDRGLTGRWHASYVQTCIERDLRQVERGTRELSGHSCGCAQDGPANSTSRHRRRLQHHYNPKAWLSVRGELHRDAAAAAYPKLRQAAGEDAEALLR
jgi:hypothetical protein